MLNCSVPLQPIVNLNHLDCLSPPATQHEFAGETSCEPKPAEELGCEKVLLLHTMAAEIQSCPGEGGGEVTFRQVEKVPSFPLVLEII